MRQLAEDEDGLLIELRIQLLNLFIAPHVPLLKAIDILCKVRLAKLYRLPQCHPSHIQ